VVKSEVEPLAWRDGALHLLDQRRLPHEVVWLACASAGDVAAAIRDMVVRGAPAIGVAAAYGLALAARGGELSTLSEAAATLRAARPTAVNLAWAVDRMMAVAAPLAGAPARTVADALEREAVAIHQEDLEANRRIGAWGAALLTGGSTVLTHCNAGALATSGFGTALGVIRAAVAAGKSIRVLADETRPYLQGARLTAWELQQDGIDVTLITDNMSGYFFSRGEIDAVVVGADRIAANGDTANKIGTYTVAVLAQRHGVPFYVAAPWSTVDFATPDGGAIPIEERSREEVVEATGIDGEGVMRTISIAPAGIAARHPAFDVTPAELITAIITDRGVAEPPFESSLRRLGG
jgi:methylthioribose-1-phosphate isomerase